MIIITALRVIVVVFVGVVLVRKFSLQALSECNLVDRSTDKMESLSLWKEEEKPSGLKDAFCHHLTDLYICTRAGR